MSAELSEAFAHSVFFTLKDPAQAEALIAACQEHLSDHEGVVYFGAGHRADDCRRPVNDESFHVALHLVFATRADHDRYQSSPRHQAFIDEQSGGWAEVRVFDANL